MSKLSDEPKITGNKMITENDIKKERKRLISDVILFAFIIIVNAIALYCVWGASTWIVVVVLATFFAQGLLWLCTIFLQISIYITSKKLLRRIE